MIKNKLLLTPKAAALPLSQRIRLYLGQITYLPRLLQKLYFGRPATCSICNFNGRFLPFGFPVRERSQCPKCGSLERHRLFALYLQNSVELDDTSRIIHFAPEPAVERIFRKIFSSYRTADAYRKNVDLTLNLEQISLPDQSVDWILCFHVLEHVNDSKALPEMFRILTRNGVLSLMVPIVEGWAQTYQAEDISKPEEREDHFGQYDHVRLYGADLRDRIISAGFTITEFTANGIDSVRYGLTRGEKIFVCRKP